MRHAQARRQFHSDLHRAPGRCVDGCQGSALGVGRAALRLEAIVNTQKRLRALLVESMALSLVVLVIIIIFLY